MSETLCRLLFAEITMYPLSIAGAVMLGWELRAWRDRRAEVDHGTNVEGS